MATLRSLRITRYLDVAPTTLTFHPRRNLLLGVNGGGKTTLLNLVAMCLNLDFRELEQTQFAVGFLLDEGGWTMDVDVSNEVSELPEGVAVRDLRAKGLEKSFTAEVRIEFHNIETKRRGSFWTNGQVATLTWPGEPAPRELAWRIAPLRLPSFVMAAARSIDRSPDIDSVHRFDEGVDFFRSIHSDTNPPFRVVYGLDKEERGISGLVPEVLDDELLDHRLQLGERLSLDSNSVEFLKAFVDATGFEKVILAADLIHRSSPDADGAFEEKFRLTLSCARGADREFIQNDLSFGQCRLWAFLYYLACNRYSVVADELVNGLHHRWIKLCVERIGDRQAFLTSQNPLLFDFVPLGTPAEPRCTFLRCDLDGAKMRWRNLDEGETIRLYEAYDAGIESVGEILQTRGLW